MSEALVFDGVTIAEQPDAPERLGRQLDRVRELMRGGQWWTLSELAEHSQGSTASVSARIRDLRKKRYGSYQIDRMHTGGGVFMYKMVAQQKEAKS